MYRLILGTGSDGKNPTFQLCVGGGRETNHHMILVMELKSMKVKDLQKVKRAISEINQFASEEYSQTKGD
jgi:hypothetical protein